MNDAQNGKGLVFVGGPVRSGTTLVQNILDSHPDVLGIPEFKHLPAIIGIRNRMRHNISLGMLDLLFSNEEVDGNIRRLIEGFLLPLLERHQSRLLSEKTPQNILVFSELIELFPEASFLFVVRDPRAIVASLLEVAKRAAEKRRTPPPFCQGLREAIWFTKKCFKSGFLACERNPGKVLIVAYEKLVEATEDETKTICDYLNLTWSEQMLKPAALSHMADKAMTCEFNSIFYSKNDFGRNPHTGNVQKWRRILTAPQQAEVSKVFKSMHELIKMGYDFGDLDEPDAGY